MSRTSVQVSSRLRSEILRGKTQRTYIRNEVVHKPEWYCFINLGVPKAFEPSNHLSKYNLREEGVNER